jgi:hypothetical protein
MHPDPSSLLVQEAHFGDASEKGENTQKIGRESGIGGMA